MSIMSDDDLRLSRVELDLADILGFNAVQHGAEPRTATLPF